MHVSGFGYTLCAISMLATFFMPESPRLHIAKGRVQDLQNAIDRMAWFNRTQVIWEDQELKWIAENAPLPKGADILTAQSEDKPEKLGD